MPYNSCAVLSMCFSKQTSLSNFFHGTTLLLVCITQPPIASTWRLMAVPCPQLFLIVVEEESMSILQHNGSQFLGVHLLQLCHDLEGSIDISHTSHREVP